MILAYCQENQSVAKELEIALSASGARFEHVHCGKLDENQGLYESLLERNEPVILLISDNFLKSGSCVHNALEMLQSLLETDSVQSIIIDGQHDGQAVPTEFERVSNVIQYMNYWQDQYLEMRKLKRTVDPSREALFNEKLKIVRGISSEIGEFLRLLRTTEYWNYNELKASQYQAFYEKVGSTATVPNNDITPTENASAPLDNPLVIAGQNSGEPEQQEQGEATDNELSNFDINAIPGADLLESKPPEEILETPEEELEAVQETDALEDELVEDNNKLLGKLVEYKKNIINGPSSDEQTIEQSSLNEVDLEELADEIATADNKDFTEVVENRDNIEMLFEETDDNPSKPETKPIEETEEQVILESTPLQEPQLSVQEVLIQSRNLVGDGRINEGLELLNTSIKLNPENTSLRYQYALLLAKYRGDYQKAADQLEQLLKYDQLNKNAYYLLAELAELNNDHLTSKNYYEKVITLDPDYYGVYHKLGMITITDFQGQEKLALKYFKKAIRQDKHNTEAHYQYAKLLHAYKGDAPKAMKHLKATLKLDAHHPEAAFDAARIYKQLGEEKKASKYYALAVINNTDLQTEENNTLFNFTSSENLETLGEDYGLINSSVSEVAPNEEEGTDQSQSDKIIDYPEDNGIIALITGATAGIGKATAELFAKQGYRLILTGRRSERLEALKTELEEKYNSKINLQSFDVSDIVATQSALESITEEWSNVDILINNAGIGRGNAPIHEGSLKDWEEMIDTNIKGMLYMTRAFSPQMVDRRSGHIINIGSIAGKGVYTNSNVYSATKFAVDGLTKSFRLDLAPHNVRVSQILPGYVATEFSLAKYGDEEKASIVYNDFTPLTAEDIAETIYFMATRPAHVTIQDVVITSTQQVDGETVFKQT